jgi:hypothetical protein
MVRRYPFKFSGRVVEWVEHLPIGLEKSTDERGTTGGRLMDIGGYRRTNKDRTDDILTGITPEMWG